MMKIKLLLASAAAALALGLTLILAACGGSTPTTGQPAGPAPSTSAPSKATSAPAAAPAPAPAGVPSPPADAVVAWQSSAQDSPGTGPLNVGQTFRAAAIDLETSGQTPDPYKAQEALLNQLAGMATLTGPLAQKDIAQLNQFFGTPGLKPAQGGPE